MAAKSITESKINTNKLTDRSSNANNALLNGDFEAANRKRAQQFKEAQDNAAKGIIKNNDDIVSRKQVDQADGTFPEERVTNNSGRSFAGKALGKATNAVPILRSAKVAYKYAKRFKNFLLFATITPWICACCLFVFSLYVVKQNLDQPFITLTNLIKVTGCTIGTADGQKCIMDNFRGQVTEYLTDSLSEDNV